MTINPSDRPVLKLAQRAPTTVLGPWSCRRLRTLAVLLLMGVGAVPAAMAAPASRPQQLTSPDQVPEGLAKSDWANIRAAYEAGRHAFQPTPTGWQARNPGQQWTTTFDRRGFVATPKTGGWTWGLELQGYGFGAHQQTIAGTPAVQAEGSRLTYQWDSAVQEWFINDQRGLEHGFTVSTRPAADPAELTAPNAQPTALSFLLAVRGGLRPHVTPDALGVEFRDAAGANVLNYAGLKVWDADGKILTSRFELADSSPAAPGTPHAVRLLVDERGARYPITIDPIAQQAYLKASNNGPASANEYFGFSVAASGDTVVVGAPYEGSSTTGINSTPDESATNAGAAYVFVRSGTTWSQQAYLKASQVTASDNFGVSVAVSGDTVVVGAYQEDSSTTGVASTPDESATDAGAAYVFVRSGTTWSQQAYLKASQVTARDNFGVSVAVSGETVVVGAYREDSSTTGVASTPDESSSGAGAAYVFVRSGTTWTQQAYLKASQVTASDNFGYSVAASGDTVVVGAPYEGSSTTGINSTPDESATNAGAAYVFVRSGTTWTQQAYLKASQVTASDNFGYSVAVSGDTVVVGAYQEDSSTTGVASTPDESATDAGAAYVFVRSGTTWSQQAYLKASQVTASDNFGYSVAVSGDTVVVGATKEDSSTTGVDSTPNESATDAGAAYVFVRSGTTWTQQAYLKAQQVTADDRFGVAVAVSGDTVVVGASNEDSSTTGVNSTPNEISINAGAAYVFVRSGATWTQQAYLKASNTPSGPGANDQFGYSVATSGETVVVGAPYEDSSATGVNSTPNESATDAGAAYVFVRSGTTWTQQAYLKAHQVTSSDSFGYSVAVSGDTVVVGAYQEDSSTTGVASTPDELASGSGAAYVFVRSGTTWAQQAYLKAQQVSVDDGFGVSVAVSGDTVVVGARQEDSSTTGVNSAPDESATDAGAAYVFVRSGTTWTQQAYLKAQQVTADDRFGIAVAVSGNTVTVGADQEDSSTTGVASTPNELAQNSGAAYVFVRSGTTWTQQAYLKAHQVSANDYFGGSVAVSGDTVVVGAFWEDSSTMGVNTTPNESASNAGAAYVFMRSGTMWTQQAYLKAHQVTAGDQFGSSVAVSGDTVVVSATSEDSSTTGVNSTPNESASSAGAAYVFVRSLTAGGTTWAQQAYLKAHQVSSNDQFGQSVAVSGDTVVVGARIEDSSTTGVNSTPNELASNAGAAYVFTGLGVATVTAPTSASIAATSATLGGNVTSDGGATITATGIVYAPTATNNNPLIGGAGVTDLAGLATTGVFTVSASSLTAGTAYTYTAYATTSAGTVYSSTGIFTTAATSPVAPTGVTAVLGNTQATVSFTAPASDGGAAITSYTVTSTPGSLTATGASSPITITGLTNGMSYTFTVTATNSVGAGSASTASSAVTPVSAPTVTSPTSASVASTSATLGGDVTATGGASLTAVGVVYSVTSANNNPQLSGTGVTNLTGTAATGVFTVSATGLTAGTAYSYAAYATNSAGTTYSSVGTFTTTVPTPTLTFTTPSTASVAVGATQTNAVTSTLSGGSYGAITYTSSDTSKATVNASTGVVTGLAVGSTTITATQAAASGFNATTSTSYTLTVTIGTPTITAAPTATGITYGQTLASSTLSGGTANVAGTFTFTTTSTAPNAGSAAQSVTFTPTDTTNYTSTTTAANVTVAKATPTLTWATPSAITYGTTLSATQLNATSSLAAGTTTYSPASGTTPSAGTQTLTATFTPTDTANYNTATGTVSLTVNKATPTITWATPSAITYGTALSATQLNATSSLAAGTITYSPASGTTPSAGTQTLTATFTPTDTTNYNTATGTASLTVNKATPTLTWATPSAITYGTTLSATQLNATSSLAAGTIVYSPANGATPSAGTQTLTATFTPTDTANYNTATGTVSLTVNKATPTITWATPSTITYGTALSATQLNATSSLAAGTIVYTPASGTTPSAGTQTLTATFTPTDTANYNTATGTVSLTVNKATPTITWATPSTISFGTALSAAQLNATASVAGTIAYSPASGAISSVGLQTLTATFTPTDATNYNPASASVSLNVIVAVPGSPTAITATTANGEATVTFTAPSNPGSSAITGYTIRATATDGSVITVNATGSPAKVTGLTPGKSYRFTVTANNSAGSSESSTVTDALTISLVNQTISFAAPADRASNSGSFALSATASSGLPVTFTLVSGPGMLAGNVVDLTGATGPIKLRASQAGNATYAAAPEVEVTFAVTAGRTNVVFSQALGSGSRVPAAELGLVLPGNGQPGSLLVVSTLIPGLNGVITLETTVSGGFIGTLVSSVAAAPLDARIQAAPVTYTITGTLLNGVLTGTIAPLGLVFTAPVPLPTGPSAAAAGLYVTGALVQAAGTVSAVVGANNEVLVLLQSATVTTGGLTTLKPDTTFALAAPGNGLITGAVNPVTTAATATLTLPGTAPVAFSGLSTTTKRTDRLIGLASRSKVGTGESVLITGLAIGGTDSKRVLIRAGGPALAAFGLGSTLPNPTLKIYRGTTLIAQNDDWNPADAAETARLGLFAFPNGSKDAAILTTLAPGAYTAHVSDLSGTGTGVALAEIYDASVNPTADYQRLVSIASRGTVSLGDGALIGGFVVVGNAPKTLLIRGIGPTLTSFGLVGALADPVLTIYDGGEALATNAGWANSAAIATAATQAGAFALTTGSRDAALLVTLKPGSYTAQVKAAQSASSGVALIEIYEVP